MAIVPCIVSVREGHKRKINRISETFTSHISKIKIYELFSGFSEVKMSIRIDVSISFIGLLQVVKKKFIFNFNLKNDPPY